jgi:hypothetical protein
MAAPTRESLTSEHRLSDMVGLLGFEDLPLSEGHCSLAPCFVAGKNEHQVSQDSVLSLAKRSEACAHACLCPMVK